MTLPAFAALLVLTASPALAQAGAPENAPGSAAGSAADGRPGPAGKQGEGQQAATSGSMMVKRGQHGEKGGVGTASPARPAKHAQP